MLTLQKDFPKMLRQALTRALLFRTFRNRTVDRQRPVNR